jgi:hypothetical protein
MMFFACYSRISPEQDWRYEGHYKDPEEALCKAAFIDFALQEHFCWECEVMVWKLEDTMSLAAKLSTIPSHWIPFIQEEIFNEDTTGA